MIEVKTDGIEDHEVVFCLEITEAIENYTAGVASFLRRKVSILNNQGETRWNGMRKEAHTLPMINITPTLYVLHDSTVSCCGVGELNAITSLLFFLLFFVYLSIVFL